MLFPWVPTNPQQACPRQVQHLPLHLPDEFPQHAGHELRRVFPPETGLLEHGPVVVGVGNDIIVEPHGVVDLWQSPFPIGVEPRVHCVADAGVGDAADLALVAEKPQVPLQAFEVVVPSLGDQVAAPEPPVGSGLLLSQGSVGVLVERGCLRDPGRLCVSPLVQTLAQPGRWAGLAPDFPGFLRLPR